MATEARTDAATASPVVRYHRPARWFHTATYLITLVLLVTGWWLRTGREGRPSQLARLLDSPDTEVHRRAGWVLVGLGAAALTLGVRAAVTFVRETLRVDRGDARWFLRWPAGAVAGRFAPHQGHFDPGQRLANIGFVVSFGVLVASGIGLTVVHGGEAFVWYLRIHRWSTYTLTALVVGHILLAVGLLPGYRGVWRSMHLGGRISAATARRLWPRS